MSFVFFFFTDTASTQIYTLSLHDALPIFDGDADREEERRPGAVRGVGEQRARAGLRVHGEDGGEQRVGHEQRSEEHTSELQSRRDLVCRLLLEKKKK